MGCDIHSFAERKLDGKWKRVEEPLFFENTEPFGWRSYSVFSFLANVRNYSNCKPISEPKGLPEDSEYLNEPSDYGNKDTKEDIERDGNYHSFSYITVEEFLAVDYDTVFRNLRGTDDQQFSYDALLISDKGEETSLREFLGQGFFVELDVLKSLGTPDEVRIVFYFDN